MVVDPFLPDVVDDHLEVDAEENVLDEFQDDQAAV